MFYSIIAHYRGGYLLPFCSRGDDGSMILAFGYPCAYLMIAMAALASAPSLYPVCKVGDGKIIGIIAIKWKIR